MAKKAKGSKKGEKKNHKIPPDETFLEVEFLRNLAQNQTQVCVRLITGEDLYGFIEFFDSNFVRLTRDSEPNVFIYKDQIKYIYELEPSEGK